MGVEERRSCHFSRDPKGSACSQGQCRMPNAECRMPTSKRRQAAALHKRGAAQPPWSAVPWHRFQASTANGNGVRLKVSDSRVWGNAAGRQVRRPNPQIKTTSPGSATPLSARPSGHRPGRHRLVALPREGDRRPDAQGRPAQGRHRVGVGLRGTAGGVAAPSSFRPRPGQLG